MLFIGMLEINSSRIFCGTVAGLSPFVNVIVTAISSAIVCSSYLNLVSLSHFSPDSCQMWKTCSHAKYKPSVCCVIKTLRGETTEECFIDACFKFQSEMTCPQNKRPLYTDQFRTIFWRHITLNETMDKASASFFLSLPNGVNSQACIDINRCRVAS